MGLSRRAALKGVVATAVGAVTGTAAYGIGYERHHIEVTRASLNVTGLPAALDGLRVGFLTDIHHSEMVPPEDVSRAVALVVDAAVDLVVLGGDYVSFSDRRFMQPVADLLRPLTAPHGVFGILGNHDDDREMPAVLSRAGVQMLKDDRTRLTIRGEALELVGLRFWTRSPVIIERLVRNANGAVLLLAHDPRRLDEAAALRVPAVLSGHTHGGQIVVPGLGAFAKRNFPVMAGLATRQDTSIFVSRGIGTVYVPMRINCPPEVAVVTLRSVDAQR